MADCDSTNRHHPGEGQAGRPARRPRRREHHDHRRRDGHPEESGEANRIADPDGDDPAGQAHRGARRRRSTSSCRWRASTTSCSAGGTSSKRTATPRLAPRACWRRRSSIRCAGELEAVKPMPAVFDQRYVKRLDGPNVKKGKNKRDLAEQLIADIRAFKANARLRSPGDAVGGEHRGVHEGKRRPPDGGVLREGASGERRRHPVQHGLRLRGPQGRRAVRQRRAEPDGRHPGAAGAGRPEQVAARRQRHQDRPDADQDDHRPGAQGAPARREWLVLHQHPGQPRRRGAGRSRVVQDQGRDQEVGARPHLPAAPLSRISTGT